jgi:GNAT superfamily N-acetyltransferase
MLRVERSARSPFPSVRVLPATADRWDDVVRVFGRRGDDPSWCWCRLFLGSGIDEPSDAAVSTPDNREALRREIAQAAIPPGLIAYIGDDPVGWTRVGRRSAFPGVGGNRALARVLENDPEAWWVTCFAIDSRHRRSGVGSALLKAAVTFARKHGATAVEGHPVDVAALKAARVSGSALYTGTMAMFVAAGFSDIARTFPTRPVMQLRM